MFKWETRVGLPGRIKEITTSGSSQGHVIIYGEHGIIIGKFYNPAKKVNR
jgi:hypothetical protein